ncbi:ABC transporter permease subunit [Gemella cuniculi]|uniref:ABC transporter permease subunit n=1 Tax=Gemella cuniculi TaxID=150240 RepID=UPI000423BDB4|nr:ABC transporter permease subunit [Gemella cuniculi]
MKLLINEFIKDYKKKTTWIYILLILFLIGGVGYINYKFGSTDNFNAATTLVSITRISTDLALIFSLVMLANNLSQEYSKGTIKFLYTKPKTRSAILTAKIILGFINFIILYVLGTAFDFILKYYIFYNKRIGLNQLSNRIEEGYFGRTVGQQLAMHSLTSLAVMIFFIAMVVLVCVVFKTQILSLVLVLLTLLGGSIIQSLTVLAISKYEWVKYHPFDVTLFNAYYSNEASRQVVKEIYKFSSANSLMLMLVAYSVVFFVISYIVNARRDITID